MIIVDVSKWQGNMDWTKAYFAGVRAAFLRASVGNQTDENFESNVSGCRENHIPFACYHYIRPAGNWRTQADLFSELLGDALPQLYAVCDLEDDGALGKSALESFVKKFCDRVTDKWGQTIMIYTRAEWFNREMPLTDWAWRMPLWVAHYTDAPQPDIPDEWSNHGKDWLFWQYSAEGNGRGREFGAQSDDIDLDRFNGSIEQFERLFGVDIEPVPEPEPDVPQVVRSLRTVNLRDEPWGHVTGKLELNLEVAVKAFQVDSQGMTWYQSGPYWFSGKWSEVVK